MCYSRVLATILRWHLPIDPSENRDHDQPRRQGKGKYKYLITARMSLGCHDVPPAELVARLGHGTPRLIDVYPTFGRLHSCFSVDSGLFVRCWWTV